MSILCNSILFDGGARIHWIATLGTTLNIGSLANAAAVDSSGNVYSTGYISTQGEDLLIVKYDTSGTIQWQRTLGGASTDAGTGIAVDSSGNVYVSGRTDVAGVRDILIAKYNTSGTIQWQRRLGGGEVDQANAIAVDSSGNVYVSGATVSMLYTPGKLIIAKYNTSGTLQWQTVLRSANDYAPVYGLAIAVDSSGNVYITGEDASSSFVLIAKYNTSGTLQWQRKLDGSGNEGGYGIAVDSSSNVYVTGYTNSQGAGVYDLLIAKYNTSGTIQWQRSLGGAAADQGLAIVVDSSSSSVYVTGYTGAYANEKMLIAKYNTSGTLQWQRTFSSGNGFDRGYGIAVDSSSNFCIASFCSNSVTGNTQVLIVKLPGDGSKTGTYGTFVYAASTLTDAARTLTDSAGNCLVLTSTLTSATPTLTDAASTLTSTTITV